MEVKILDEKNHMNSIKLNQSITGYDLLHKYYPTKDKSQIVAFFLNNKVHDLFAKITNDATVKFIFQKDFEGWRALNYGCALVLAYVIKKVYPDAVIAIANNNDEGFYLDFDYKKQLKQEDFLQLTEEMTKVLNTNFAISLFYQDLKTTLNDTYKNNLYAQEYAKLSQVNNQVCSYLINDKVKVIASSVAVGVSQLIKYFKLTSITGAYWMGNDKNKQLQRITGIADWSKEELELKMNQITERKNRDHRILGKKLGIFMFSDEVGKGLPMFLPNGMMLKKVIQEYLRQQEFKWDYQEVATPVLGSIDLYKKSGHWEHYRENMFNPIAKENEALVLRPMTCPHHCMIYQSTPRSYRDLPIRLSEHALLYRYETSGALTGLERVRSMELTDSHIFARPDQMKEEFKRCYHLIADVLKTFNIKIDYLSLSLRDAKDSEKYYRDDEMWDNAENALREVLNELKLNYKEMIGEAAFYGPKLDIQIKTPLGHEITISTIQFDFLLPKRFNLTYTNNQNQPSHPVIVHRGIIGTYERFIATLLEQTQGVFPLWLAPKQLVILPINDSEEIMEYSASIRDAFKEKNIRASIISTETLGKRIRTVHEEKVPYIVVIGNKELKTKKITYHTYQDQKHDLTVTQDELIKIMVKKINSKEDDIKRDNDAVAKFKDKVKVAEINDTRNLKDTSGTSKTEQQKTITKIGAGNFSAGNSETVKTESSKKIETTKQNSKDANIGRKNQESTKVASPKNPYVAEKQIVKEASTKKLNFKKDKPKDTHISETSKVAKGNKHNHKKHEGEDNKEAAKTKKIKIRGVKKTTFKKHKPKTTKIVKSAKPPKKRAKQGGKITDNYKWKNTHMSETSKVEKDNKSNHKKHEVEDNKKPIKVKSNKTSVTKKLNFKKRKPTTKITKSAKPPKRRVKQGEKVTDNYKWKNPK